MKFKVIRAHEIQGCAVFSVTFNKSIEFVANYKPRHLLVADCYT